MAALTVDEIDAQNTKRMFAGVLLSVLGVDQTSYQIDASIQNSPNQFEVFESSNGRTSTAGRSNRLEQTPSLINTVTISPFAWLVLGVAVFVIVKNV